MCLEKAKLIDLLQGPFMTFVDVSIAPWLLRLSRVLHPYRGWPLAQPGTRLGLWIDALEASEAVTNTMSDPVLYLENYERYAGKLQLSFSSLLFCSHDSRAAAGRVGSQTPEELLWPWEA